MATADELPMNEDNPSTSGSGNEAIRYFKNNGDSVNQNDGNRLRKDMSNLQPIPIRISSEKILNAHGPRYKDDSLERFCPCNPAPNESNN